MDRRQFITWSTLSLALSGVSVQLIACSDDDDGTTSPTGNNGAGDVDGSISSNHGHSVRITAAQIDAGVAVTLTLIGGTHGHTVTLDAGDVAAIDAGTLVSKESSFDSGHPHTVSFQK